MRKYDMLDTVSRPRDGWDARVVQRPCPRRAAAPEPGSRSTSPARIGSPQPAQRSSTWPISPHA
ncbi:hypothetical protein [Nonomuraea gerenzanensis]|uniref:hypothetical protein n=1 Tax=Nonomuraea gerenzanensis TaxID=93944 RepID=UPI001CD935D6|nr:hypothetical protein [Nonomuraea gerenzanensis]UBU08803.1 hypothetical protein LCN96_30955 [Nonomuraea gerenzanensis]